MAWQSGWGPRVQRAASPARQDLRAALSPTSSCRLCQSLLAVHLFILAGAVYYCFQEPVGRAAPHHDVAGDLAQENVEGRQEVAAHPSVTSEVENKEERLGSWLLRKLWLGRFPASDTPKTQSRK
ncbi:hypothetical protein TREES_T100012015 [Tupaia chinensis]|uniref:Uncharacterized protein n=1 Tax=Tupaia chinensis TaxID=246437 RepID=L9KPN5_TUPCH|nr:hypothetical protein TREES_T100012015 [Tupaia chinensis]